METVAFITTKTSKKGDLILSIAIEDRGWEGGVRTLVLLRCPKHESMFAESERGITVSMEGENEKQGDLEGNLLSECAVDGSGKTIWLKTPNHGYALDIRKLSTQVLGEMGKFLIAMNFDGKARMAGL